jgi:alpha-beta hydrolase superfamily lysophospholipase
MTSEVSHADDLLLPCVERQTGEISQVCRDLAARSRCRWTRLRADRRRVRFRSVAGAAFRLPARTDARGDHQWRFRDARLVRHRLARFRAGHAKRPTTWLESAQQVAALIARENERGIPDARIVLAGFSQGGVLRPACRLAPSAAPGRNPGAVVLSCQWPISWLPKASAGEPRRADFHGAWAARRGHSLRLRQTFQRQTAESRELRR